MRGYVAPLLSGFGATGASEPSTPTLTIVTGTGQVTATIAGDSGVTNYLKYKASANSTWQDGGSRSGDGDLVVTSLANDVPYIFIAWSENAQGLTSTPAVAVIALLTAEPDAEFDQALADSVAGILATLSELIKYLPSGGGQREILAVVTREQPEKLGGAPHGRTPKVTISVANDSTTGISSSEINTGADKVELALRIGQTVQQRRIANILSQDHGFLELEII